MNWSMSDKFCLSSKAHISKDLDLGRYWELGEDDKIFGPLTAWVKIKGVLARLGF